MKKASIRIVWGLHALEDLKEILVNLKKESKQASAIVKKAIIEKTGKLTDNPFMYEKDKLKIPPNRSFRAFLVFNYRVSYQVKTDLNEIRIVRIRHTGREPLGY